MTHREHLRRVDAQRTLVALAVPGWALPAAVAEVLGSPLPLPEACARAAVAARALPPPVTPRKPREAPRRGSDWAALERLTAELRSRHMGVEA